MCTFTEVSEIKHYKIVYWLILCFYLNVYSFS